MPNDIIEQRLLFLTRQFLLESGTSRAISAIHNKAHLEKELGIDSLSKVELVRRIENSFHIHLNDSAVASADNLEDFVNLIKNAKPEQKILNQEFSSTLAAAEIDLTSAETITEVLKRFILHDPKRPHIYLQDEQGKEDIITYGQLFDCARQIAHGLVHRGIKSGETVAIMLPTSRGFFYSFFGVLFAGAIPVPIYPPFRPDRIEEYIKREAKILQNAEIRLLITFSSAEMLSYLLKSFIPSLHSVITPEALMTSKGTLREIVVTAEHPVLIQYTSGSTGDPKGVLLLQKNLMANIRTISKAITISPSDAIVSWLPLYHDMGLMSWLGSLYYGLPLTIMSPLTFLRRPERWLWAIHYHRATISAGPNFAYELCVKKITNEMIEGLDLSHWRLAMNGAETVNPQTLFRFIKKFKAYGFRETTFFPVYGLAENTVALTFPQTAPHLRIEKISRSLFETAQIATIKNRNFIATDVLEMVGCGSAIPDHEIRIVNNNNDLLPERHIGNLQFRGPSAMLGYYHNPIATKAIYHDGWWDTGDLGYLTNGELFVTGRKKDLIIKAGRNISPEAIENIVNQILGVRKGCVIAFGVRNEKLGTEKLVVVAETHAQNKSELLKIQTEINEQMSIHIGMPPDEIKLVSTHSIPKTSSGKLQRSTCKEAYLTNHLQQNLKPPYFQMSKLFISGFSQRIKRLAKQSLYIIYSSLTWLLVILTAILMWPIIALLPKRVALKFTRHWLRCLFTVSACRITVTGQENLHRSKPCIFAVNHTSFSDTPLLIAILPDHAIFIAKKELTKNPFFRTFIKKFSYIDIDRFDFSQNLTDTTRIAEQINNGKSIIIFPEGTFSYASGLRPFKAGAFQLAVDTQTPIVPVAITGARKFLRSGTLLLKPTTFQITIGQPILPQGNDWDEVNRLRNVVKQEIAQYCGEQSLDSVSTEPVVKK
jgi:acyl carrier protein